MRSYRIKERLNSFKEKAIAFREKHYRKVQASAVAGALTLAGYAIVISQDFMEDSGQDYIYNTDYDFGGEFVEVSTREFAKNPKLTFKDMVLNTNRSMNYPFFKDINKLIEKDVYIVKDNEAIGGGVGNELSFPDSHERMILTSPVPEVNTAYTQFSICEEEHVHVNMDSYVEKDHVFEKSDVIKIGSNLDLDVEIMSEMTYEGIERYGTFDNDKNVDMIVTYYHRDSSPRISVGLIYNYLSLDQIFKWNNEVFSFGLKQILDDGELGILMNILDDAKFVNYWDLPSESPEKTDRGELMRNILVTSPMVTYIDFDKTHFHKWVDEKNKENILETGSLEDVLELDRDYLRDNREYKKDLFDCEQYTEEFITIFNDIKKTNDNLKFVNLSPIVGYATTFDQKGLHGYVRVTSTDGKNLFVSFVDPTWADNLYMDLDGHDEIFDALDGNHHIPIKKTGITDAVIGRVKEGYGTRSMENNIPVTFNGLNMTMEKEALMNTLNEEGTQVKGMSNRGVTIEHKD
jgi:hypothetical protein